MRNNITIVKAFVAVAAAATLAGCASSPVTGGFGSPLNSKEEANTKLFKDAKKQEECFKNLKACVSNERVPIGTEKAKVFDILGIDGSTLTTLTKQATKVELYGQDQLQIPFDQKESAQNFLNSLEGLTATFRDVQSNKRFGLTASRTDVSGVAVTFNFVFQDGKLYNPIGLTTAPVNQSQNKGYLSDMGVEGLIKMVKP